MDVTEQESGVGAAVVCTDPLVTLCARTPRAPMGIAGAKPGAFHDRKSLHLIALTEPLQDDGRQTKIARDIQAVSAEVPDGRFVVMAPTEFDAYLLASLGVAAFPANAQIFTDELVFRPIDDTADHDTAVRSGGEHETLLGDLSRVLRLDAHEGEETRAQKISRARVALCLSPSDARASTEYLLCGLPVVATKAAASAGRYLMPPSCRVVPPEPRAIAAAVDALMTARVPKAVVRNHVLHLLRMERHNFLIAANKLAKEVFGVADPFATIAPFAKAWRAQ